MSSGLRIPRQELVHITPLPQLVPSRACFSCDVCCRFPEADSFLRPYFTAQEIRHAVSRGLDPARFPEPTGCQISLVPNPSGEGYLCPAFDPSTSRCRIYDVRPLDCQIYPLALMWSRDRREVLLGWDSKCPFLREQAGTADTAPASLRAYAELVAARIEEDGQVEVLAVNPRLIGPFQDDVVMLRSLPRLSERLSGQREASGARREAPGLPSQASPRAPRLSPLTVADRSLVEQALASTDWARETPLAAYAFAPHFIWRELFAYWRADIAGHLCLFAEYEDGLFMPLPPLSSGRTGLVSREASLAENQPYASRFTRNAVHLSPMRSLPASLSCENKTGGRP